MASTRMKRLRWWEDPATTFGVCHRCQRPAWYTWGIECAKHRDERMMNRAFRGRSARYIALLLHAGMTWRQVAQALGDNRPRCGPSEVQDGAILAWHQAGMEYREPPLPDEPVSNYTSPAWKAWRKTRLDLVEDWLVSLIDRDAPQQFEGVYYGLLGPVSSDELPAKGGA